MSLPSSEQWRDVPGYEGLYAVSDYGRVRSVRRVLHPTPDASRGGRRSVMLTRDGRRKRHNVASMVLTVFVGPRPEKLQACHNNGDPTDDRATNLRWDTPSANALDAVNQNTNWQTRKTHCPRGHDLVPPNLRTFINRPNRRECLTCHRGRR